MAEKEKIRPEQEQNRPGKETKMKQIGRAHV